MGFDDACADFDHVEDYDHEEDIILESEDVPMVYAEWNQKVKKQIVRVDDLVDILNGMIDNPE